jgi:hypothetical protein
MEWRELRKSGEIFDHLPRIFEAEEGMPRWFRSASSVWTRDRESFRGFVEDCSEAWGLFDLQVGTMSAVVYFEAQDRPDVLSIHLSVIGKIAPSDFIEQTAILRNMAYRRGVRRIQGWVLGKNRSLRALLAAIGFLDTDLRMDRGESHGRVLRWHLLEARRA